MTATTPVSVLDPQVDEDALIYAIRLRAGSVKALVHRWEMWAASDRELGRRDTPFGRNLKQARADVRMHAGEILSTMPAAEAAAEMMRHARTCAVGEPQAICLDYDSMALSYTRARAWQTCAQCIDPSLPDVQPIW